MFYARKAIRLRGFDYSSPGYYFVTICTNNSEKLFAPKISSKYGHTLPAEIAASNWSEEFLARTITIEEQLGDIERKFPCIIDFHCIMPNHVHMILGLHQQSKASAEIRKWQDLSEIKRVKLGTIVSAFKSWTTRALGFSAFQPKYYEHIIREEKALERIRDYILQNPYTVNLHWKELEQRQSHIKSP